MARKVPQPQQETEEMNLSQAGDMLLSETRMVLPGIQALFGFQLVAVFNAAFGEKLTQGLQELHLLATVLVAVTIAIIMTPAAYHRQTGTRHVTQRFIDISTRLLLISVVPLALGICLEVYLIGRMILKDELLLLLISAVLFTVFMFFWFGLPNSKVLERLFAGSGD
jgi:hypothetical protein